MSQSTRGHMLVPSAHVLWVQGGSSLAISGESVGPALDMALGLGEEVGGRLDPIRPPLPPCDALGRNSPSIKVC